MTPLATLKDAYQRALTLPPDDLWVIDAVFSSLIATFHPALQTESVWLRVIGPPSCGKTECIRPLRSSQRCIFVSSMTDNSLISGYRDPDTNADPSLILQLNHKVLVIKDLTDLLCHHKQTTQKLFGDLRDAYDGDCSKASGQTGLTTYESRFGIVVCVTDVVDTFPEFTQQLGERFLTIRMSRTSRNPEQSILFLQKVEAAAASKFQWEADLRTTMLSSIDCLTPLYLTNPVPTIPDPHKRQLLSLSYLIAQLRTTPVNGTSVDAEVGSRLLQQFRNIGLAHAFADLRTVWDESDTVLIRRLAFDTLTRDRRKFILALLGQDTFSKPITIQQLCFITNRPASELSNLLLQFTHIGVVRKLNKAQYILSDKIRALLDETKLFQHGEHFPSLTRINTVPEPLIQGTLHEETTENEAVEDAGPADRDPDQNPPPVPQPDPIGTVLPDQPVP
jgi:hypothetical protein